MSVSGSVSTLTVTSGHSHRPDAGFDLTNDIIVLCETQVLKNYRATQTTLVKSDLIEN